MARYTGPKNRICRIFGEPILGSGKDLAKNSNPPGQHGPSRKRKTSSEYAIQLMEKQKAKYTYGVLERQFRNMFKKATAAQGITGEVLLQLCESRLDNVVFRMGIASSRRAARQIAASEGSDISNVKIKIINGLINLLIYYRIRTYPDESL